MTPADIERNERLLAEAKAKLVYFDCKGCGRRVIGASSSARERHKWLNGGHCNACEKANPAAAAAAPPPLTTHQKRRRRAMETFLERKLTHAEASAVDALGELLKERAAGTPIVRALKAARALDRADWYTIANFLTEMRNK